MEKKLPSMYRNEITKPINNSMLSYYSKQNNNNIKKEYNNSPEEIKYEISVKRKIYDIFRNNKLNYIINVEIVLNDDTVSIKEIIGQTKNYLITIDNDKIYFENIKDIKNI